MPFNITKKVNNQFQVIEGGIEGQNWPFCFLKEYGSFLSETDGSKLYILRSKNTVVAVKKYNSAFLSIVRFLSIPLSMEAKPLTGEEERIFLDSLVIFFKKNAFCDRIVQSENFALFQAYPKGAIYAPYGTYRINLDYDLDKLWSAVQSRYKSSINQANKSDIRIKKGFEYLPKFYSIHKETLERTGLFCDDFTYFEALFNKLKNNALCLIAESENGVEGGLVVLFTKYGGFYLFGGSSSFSSSSGIVKALHWHCIKLLKEKDVDFYDFVGARLSKPSNTKLQGIQDFKRRFGSTLVKGYLWKKDINKFKCAVYDIVLRAKLALKGSKPPIDIITQERIAHKEQNLSLEIDEEH